MQGKSNFALTRLMWLIRKQLDRSTLGIPVEVLASEIANGFAVVFRARVLGRTASTPVEIDYPDGLWQVLRRACGLSYRKRVITLTCYQIFPEFRDAADKSITWIEHDIQGQEPLNHTN